MATRRAGERLVVPGHPDYEPDKDIHWIVGSVLREFTAESAHLKPYDGVKQDDGWDY